MDHTSSVCVNSAAAEVVLQKILSAAMSQDCLKDTLTMIMGGARGPESINACLRCLESLLQNVSAAHLTGILEKMLNAGVKGIPTNVSIDCRDPHCLGNGRPGLIFNSFGEHIDPCLPLSPLSPLLARVAKAQMTGMMTTCTPSNLPHQCKTLQ